MTANAKIILLNGVGSAGKSSIAKALQDIASEPYLHVQMDTFLAMLPEAYSDHPDSFSYKTDESHGVPEVIIETGPLGARTLRGMRHAVAAMAAQGNNLIVDDVMLDGVHAEYLDLLSEFDVKTVGVFAPLDVLERRERERRDRMMGLARWQYERVHRGIDYDLTIESGVATPRDCALEIREVFSL